MIASTSGMVSVTTKPARKPRLTKLTIRTIPTASARARMKWLTASVTTWGWSAVLCISMPTGRSAATVAISASSSAPKVWMFSPCRIAT